MGLEDKEKKTFISNKGLFYYRVISFGLKNVEVTYQRLVNKVFQGQNWKKHRSLHQKHASQKLGGKDHIFNHEGAFVTLQKYQRKLYPRKCVVGGNHAYVKDIKPKLINKVQ